MCVWPLPISKENANPDSKNPSPIKLVAANSKEVQFRVSPQVLCVVLRVAHRYTSGCCCLSFWADISTLPLGSGLGACAWVLANAKTKGPGSNLGPLVNQEGP